MSALWLGACSVCGGEVAFNEPAPATVRCYFGHVGPAPTERRAAEPNELVLELDAERTAQVTLTFPYEAARAFYLAPFHDWLLSAKIPVLAEMISPGRPWVAVFTFRGGWPRSDAARVIAWWRRQLGAGLTGGSARVLG